MELARPVIPYLLRAVRAAALCWESPDLGSVPITPPGETATWTTKVEVPADVAGLIMLLSVASLSAQ